MEVPFAEDKDERERWYVGASLWMAIGGETLNHWWQDLRTDPLMTPVSLEEITTKDKNEIGRWGEDLATRFLRQQEWMKILWRNFRAPGGGEVDIVCRHGDVLVFVEVKTRTSVEFSRPITAVDQEKQHLIARGALEWLRLLGSTGPVFRFDIVEIVFTGGKPPDIQRVENAFELPDDYFLP